MGKAVFRLDVIGWVCTAGSFMKGQYHIENLIREMEEGTRIPCTTGSTVVMAVLRQLGVKKMYVYLHRTRVRLIPLMAHENEQMHIR